MFPPLASAVGALENHVIISQCIGGQLHALGAYSNLAPWPPPTLLVAAPSAGLLYSVMSQNNVNECALHEIVNAQTRANLTNQMV